MADRPHWTGRQHQRGKRLQGLRQPCVPPGRRRPYAYIATIDPFHGNIVTAYTRKPGKALTDHPPDHGRCSIPSASSTRSRRGRVITSWQELSIGDGDDEFLVALRGPLPHQGVYYYKSIDLAEGLFERWRVSSSSAARIALGDFDGDGRWDSRPLVTTRQGYYLCDNSQVNVFLNRFGNTVSQ